MQKHVTLETLCSADRLQLWGEMVDASVWQISVELDQYKIQKTDETPRAGSELPYPKENKWFF